MIEIVEITTFTNYTGYKFYVIAAKLKLIDENEYPDTRRGKYNRSSFKNKVSTCTKHPVGHTIHLISLEPSGSSCSFSLVFVDVSYYLFL